MDNYLCYLCNRVHILFSKFYCWHGKKGNTFRNTSRSLLLVFQFTAAIFRRELFLRGHHCYHQWYGSITTTIGNLMKWKVKILKVKFDFMRVFETADGNWLWKNCRRPLKSFDEKERWKIMNSFSLVVVSLLIKRSAEDERDSGWAPPILLQKSDSIRDKKMKWLPRIDWSMHLTDWVQ